VAKFNHPGDGSKSHAGLAYSEVGDKTVQLMEVQGLNEEKAFVMALNARWHIAPEGSDDTHSPTRATAGLGQAFTLPDCPRRTFSMPWPNGGATRRSTGPATLVPTLNRRYIGWSPADRLRTN